MTIVTVNAGSSSLRLAAFKKSVSGLKQVARQRYELTHQNAIECIVDFFHQHPQESISAVAHRVVHGGSLLSGPCRIDESVEVVIRQMAPLAPLHNPAALALIDSCRKILGQQIPQLAVFDTDFYQHLPDTARYYALPLEQRETQGIRRYGFHGIAHQAMYQKWLALTDAATDRRRVISIQLGSGCSITAVNNGQAMDTSMGFSPMEGLMMATRCGDIDPGVLIHLQRTTDLGLDALEDLLNKKSGLLGMSGISADIRVLLSSDSPSARKAISLYCYRVRKYIGAYLAVLNGADAIVFGGGVGEHAPLIRSNILENMQGCGIELDVSRNQSAVGKAGCISKPNSPVAVWTLPVDEEQLIAQQTLEFLDNAGPD